MASKRIASIGDHCVSCGSCVVVCPKKAIHMYKGITAVVNNDLCIGCTKCERVCPAGIIEMIERVHNEKMV